MTISRLVLRSLCYHRRMHTGVLFGTLLASAILTGALLVGDSVDYSLRQFALMRLGDVHFALDSGNRLFAEDLTGKLRTRTGAPVAAALRVRGMALFTAGDNGREKTQVNQVKVMGVDADFWGFGTAAGVKLGPYETALSRRLASTLGVHAGDEISLRIAKPDLLSRDAPLSSHEEDSSTRALFTVKEILPDSNLGRFSLSANQTAPYNAFVDLDWLQQQVELPRRANLMLIGEGATQRELDRAVRESWEPEHVGMRFRHHPSGIMQLETDRVFLDPAVARVALKQPQAAGTLAYLVNSISKGDRSTPYSFAIAGSAPEGMRDDEAVISRWLADQLEAAPGDTLTVTYYELQPSNKFVVKSHAFAVHRIAEMADLALDRDLMPTFPGLSNVNRCRDWQIGMPLDDDLLQDPDNEAYWEQYGPTPKVVVTLSAGQQLWANRFGDLMTVRFPGGASREDSIREMLRQQVEPGEIGLAFAPVRDQALDSVANALDLGGLFLGMSFFLIVSALLLTALLFAFGVQQRTAELGTLVALGFRPAQVRTLFLAEGAVIALLGAAAGTWAGTAYTRALIFGLSRHWQGAVANAAIVYHVAPGTFIKGAGISAVCAVGALAIAVWRQTRHPARELLAMDFTQDLLTPRERGHGARLWPAVCGLVLSLAVVVFVQVAEVDDVVLPFFAAGSLLLLSGLGLCRYVLSVLSVRGADEPPTLLKVALLNATRRRGRSLSVITLLATGCFLVLAVSSMREDLSLHADQRWSGTGGFELYAETTIPFNEDLADMLDETDVDAVAIRVRDGDDASCLNLNYAQTPRLLGVSVDDLSAKRAFLPAGESDDLWDLLDLTLPGDTVPALVGDTDTAMWGLRKRVGVERGDVLEYRDETGRPVFVKLVGCLPMRLSALQGTVLISDRAFTRLYPSEQGFRMFLIDTPHGAEGRIAARLNAQLERFGIDAVPTLDRLREFYAVESTYLAMFLVLGGLGLTLGSVAMGVVVLRNLLERRREIAMFRAMGFRHRTLFGILLTEYGMLLLMGTTVGAMAAAVSMAPTVTSSATSLSLGVQVGVLAAIVLTGLGCIAVALRIGLATSGVAALRDE